MNQIQQRSVWQYVLILSCLVSVLLFSAASATHTHSGAATNSVTQDCRFCAVSATNRALIVPLPLAVAALCVLVILLFQADYPSTSPHRHTAVPRSPPV